MQVSNLQKILKFSFKKVGGMYVMRSSTTNLKSFITDEQHEQGTDLSHIQRFVQNKEIVEDHCLQKTKHSRFRIPRRQCGHLKDMESKDDLLKEKKIF